MPWIATDEVDDAARWLTAPESLLDTTLTGSVLLAATAITEKSAGATRSGTGTITASASGEAPAGVVLSGTGALTAEATVEPRNAALIITATSAVPIAVRVKNVRYDGMLTGYLHGAPKFTKTDPGGYRAASFVVDQRLGFRTDMVQDYSRVYFYDKRSGATVFEGDVSHPGKSVSDDGALLEVQIDGGAERLNDWSGMRIYIDRDMTAWKKHTTSVVSTTVETGDDRGGSGDDALTLAFPQDTHVDTEYKCEAIYTRVRESGQQLGWYNYAWDGGQTNASWRVISMVTPPSTVVRDQALSTSGSGGSGAVVGGSIPEGAQWAFLQLLWNSGPSNTGSGVDVCWVSFTRVIVIVRLKLKDGSWKSGASYGDTINAYDVVNDLLGDQLAATFDGANATVETGAGLAIGHLAFPDGVTPAGVLEELLKFEGGCTYFVGPSRPGVDKYTFKWVARSQSVRYEFVLGTDDYSNGAQSTDQYNVAVARWQSPAGRIKNTTTTQTIPDMDAIGRTRRFFQDLGAISGNEDQAVNANNAVLEDHRYPVNGGRVTVAREVVDLFTGRRVQPYEIEPGYLCRLVGIDPEPDALNVTAPNGGTVCRIVTTDYDADTHAVSLDLDSTSWSLFRAIARANRHTGRPQRKAF